MTDSPIHNHLVNVPPEDRMESLIEFLSSYIEQYHGGSVELIAYDDDKTREKKRAQKYNKKA